MDCLTARHHLDCLHEGNALSVDNDVADQQFAEHLEHCSACQNLIEDWRHFDRRFYSTLMSSSVPEDLESRLLSLIDSELADGELEPDSSIRTPPAKLRVHWRRIASVAAVALMVACSWMIWQTPARPLNFNEAEGILTTNFRQPDSLDWQQLNDFDGTFALADSDRDLRPFRLSSARGIDLGGSPAQDAAVYQFRLKNWSGILTVLPTEQFTGVPDVSTPSVQSGRSTLQWQSTDGKRTYICFVHKGSVSGLAHELFGRLA